MGKVDIYLQKLFTFLAKLIGPDLSLSFSVDFSRLFF